MKIHPLALTLALACASGTVSAHTKLLQASPAANATVAAPSTIQLNFSEALEPAFSSIQMFTAKGEEIPLAKAKVDNQTPKTLSVAVPKLVSGSYSVKWSVVAKDGHRIKNSYRFTVMP